MEPQYLLVSDISRRTGKTPATVRWWTDSGKLPAIRTASGTRLIERQDLENFLERRRRQR